MALVLMGRKFYDFTNDKGQNYKGIKLHCLQEFATPQEGTLTEVVSVSENNPAYAVAVAMPFNCLFTPVYNRYGRIDDLIVRDEPAK